MSTIENNQSLNAILDKLGIKNEQKIDKRGNTSSLGQEDFLKLMTTQLQNQDPFAPMENAEFISQMAQFSTVTGITEMGQSLKDMSSKLSEFLLIVLAYRTNQWFVLQRNPQYLFSPANIYEDTFTCTH